jgi:hypothetical protein
MNLKTINSDAVRQAVGTKCFVSGALAIHGSNAENVLTTVAITHIINGEFRSLGAQTEIDLSGLSGISSTGVVNAAAGGYAAIPAGSECKYVLCVNAAGTIRVVEGDIKSVADAAEFPNAPADHAAFGGIYVKNGTTSDFVLGTTDLDTAGITDTYHNFSLVPAS